MSCCMNVVPVQSFRLYSGWRPPERRYVQPTADNGGKAGGGLTQSSAKDWVSARGRRLHAGTGCFFFFFFFFFSGNVCAFGLYSG